MKAKTISGDIITVIPKQYDGYVGYIEPATGYHYDAENLTIVSFDDDFKPDYWTRLEHQYAGMAMQGMLNNSYLAGEFRKDRNNGIEDMSKIITKAAAVYAHALVEKMKEVK